MRFQMANVAINNTCGRKTAIAELRRPVAYSKLILRMAIN
ncbi:hypothetical protein LTSEALA_2877 [Salmonella enterica subsp. enterica serovar Alachua str. R6-377]|uniref:Uncharacterized protein n=1 Tax=Salmonella enterica subsp. enterica serovar Alachua str. R6-377 TaxID=913241 RepID=G5LQ31_SALET|nr:hypothetical protein LTSEALA_2877 [Salmonella enterica subsp. enterica serovar Alachua str. R6-377]ESC69159.1 hypothetical protein SEEN4881_14071 [Salmonella enterica subsp. enterica serovar Newport str. WA_14881]